MQKGRAMSVSVTTKNKQARQAKSGFDRWKDTIDTAFSDPRWHEYDCDIQQVVAEFNRHLAGVTDFRSLDWRIIKAVIWTETAGPEHAAWRSNPMQIGNPGDPGLRALLFGDEGGDLVLPPDTKKRLIGANIRGNPAMNMRAGTGYLLMRLAHYRIGTVLDPVDTGVYTLVARRGDSYATLARTNGTTIDTLKRLNQGAAPLGAGQILRYQKASVRKIICGWDIPTSQRIAIRYNVGDGEYARKLDYCLAVIRKCISEGVACAA
jgi:hypothetical protein